MTTLAVWLATVSDLFDVDHPGNLIRVRETKAYGRVMCFTEEEALELLLKLATELGVCVED